jgi:hypothetical protein
MTATKTIRNGDVEIRYVRSYESDNRIHIGAGFILCSELIGVLRLMRMYIDEDMSGFCTIELCYDSERYSPMWVTVFDSTSVELYYTDGSTELTIEELLEITRFMLQQLGKS